MARRKQVAPMQRIPSGQVMEDPRDAPDRPSRMANGHKEKSTTVAKPSQVTHSGDHPGLTQLVVSVAGIYASFLSWGFLQERLTTTNYSSVPTKLLPNPPTERFTFPVVLNTIQSSLAALVGFIYLSASTSGSRPPIFPTKAITGPLVLVSITSSLASPFGYASLAHVDYLTFVLAKSCKLLPVMFLHLAIFQTRYPLYKYLVVFAVTAGVATFTIYHPSSSKKRSTTTGNSTYGLSLLGVNLLFDGLTNTVQDHMFNNPKRYGRYSGPQMMVALNLLCTVLTAAFLLLEPYMPQIPFFFEADQPSNELHAAISFLSRHPSTLYDALGFAACGAMGQVFIYHTISRFGSILLVTVTVTRKMLTMLLSVVWFGHRLTEGQWIGVGLVFGGVGMEGYIQRQEKLKKEEATRKHA